MLDLGEQPPADLGAVGELLHGEALLGPELPDPLADAGQEVLGQAALPGEVVGHPGPAQTAKSWLRSLNALNSIALPDGSRKNIVHCSPGSPSKRT